VPIRLAIDAVMTESQCTVMTPTEGEGSFARPQHRHLAALEMGDQLV
jgi:hypothetical protein